MVQEYNKYEDDDEKWEKQYYKEFDIDRSIFNKDQTYSTEEIIKILNNTYNFINDIKSKNINLDDYGYIITSRKTFVLKDFLKKINPYKNDYIKIKYRKKNKYNIEVIHNAHFVEKITVKDKTYYQSDIQKSLDYINKFLNSDDCCYLRNKEIYYLFAQIPIFKNDNYTDFCIDEDNKKIFKHKDYLKTKEISLIDINNNIKKCNFFISKTMYDFLLNIKHNIQYVNLYYTIKNTDIEYIKYNDKETIEIKKQYEKYEDEKEFYNYLKTIKINTINEIKFNRKMANDKKTKKNTTEKNIKNKNCSQRVTC